MRKCEVCGETKFLDLFARSKYVYKGITTRGRRKTCKLCKSKYSMRNKHKNHLRLHKILDEKLRLIKEGNNESSI